MLESATTKLAPLHSRLLSLLRQCENTGRLKQIHALLVAFGFSLSPLCTSNILRVAVRSVPGDFSYAALVFHQAPSPNASPWNTMIRACHNHFRHEEALVYYARMLREGVLPDKHTYPLLLKSLSQSDSRLRRHQILVHGHVLVFGFGDDLFVINSLISSYANGGDWNSAFTLFDGMPERDRISWTAMVNGFFKSDMAEEGLSLFLEMRWEGFEVDEVTVASVLNGAGMVGNVWFGRCIHCLYVACGRVKQDEYVGTALMGLYAKCGQCDDARKVFEDTSFRNVVTWSALIAGYVHCDRNKDALLLFQDMLVEGLKPNQVTLGSVLTACAQLGALDQGRWMHNYIIEYKLGLSSIIGTELIDMYAKCGSIDDALAVFNELPDKDVYQWTAMINGMAMHGLAVQCLDLFSQMLDEGLTPNEVTFIGVLCACSHAGLVDRARKLFKRMLTDYGIKPELEHFGCMVDLLGRAGHLEEALSLIKSMPMEPSAGVWGALFGACMIHKDFVLGERIGKHLVQLEPNNSGRYSLLANMYSFSEKWDEVASVRMAMKGRRVEKTLACSWLEVNGVLHEFTALDDSHFQSKDIYETLDAITELMQLEGYILLLDFS